MNRSPGRTRRESVSTPRISTPGFPVTSFSRSGRISSSSLIAVLLSRCLSQRPKKTGKDTINARFLPGRDGFFTLPILISFRGFVTQIDANRRPLFHPLTGLGKLVDHDIPLPDHLEGFGKQAGADLVHVFPDQ